MIGKIKRLLQKPPLEIVKTILRRLAALFVLFWQHLHPVNLSFTKFLSKVGRSQNQEKALSNILDDRGDFFESLDEEIYLVDESPEDIIDSAEKFMAHTFDFLGSGPTDLGEKINWHRDFKSGKVWPRLPKNKLVVVDLDDDSDVKIPWELSRFQHLITLGKAFRVTGDEKYAEEFKAQVSDWISENEVGIGVNWACTMDVAIRAVNWIWASYLFKASKILNDEFWLKLFHSLYVHGRFTRANLEWGTIRGNHYLSDIVGLVYLGVFFKETKEGKRWLSFSKNELEKEMMHEVYPDGVDHEASTLYQRLVLELFTSATILLQVNNFRFSNGFLERLEKMFDFVEAYTKPDGSVAMFGDADDGRLHILSEYTKNNINDHRYLLSIGAVLFDRADLKASAAKFWTEAWWLLGDEGKVKYDQLPEIDYMPISKAFYDGGFYVMRNEKTHIMVDCGPVGLRGGGGHGHNDALSLELYLNGQALMTDSGTYVYTSDPTARNRFRGTAAHNVIVVDGEEMATLGEEGQLWSIADEAKPKLIKFESTDSYDLFVGEHHGNMKSLGVICRRHIYFDKKSKFILVKDEIKGTGNYSLELNWHLVAGNVIIDKEEKEAFVQYAHGSSTIIKIIDEKASLETRDDWVSYSYGTKVEASTLKAAKKVDLPAEFITVVSSIDEQNDSSVIEEKTRIGLRVLSASGH